MEIVSNSQSVQSFDFAGFQLRALLRDGDPWFVRNDACAALGIRNPNDATSSFDEEDKGVATTDTLGGRQQVAVISEAGLYQLIFQSRKEEAKAFKKWVTSEVLPAIRRTGAYEKPKTLEERSLEILGELTARVEQQQRELEVARPKAATFDKILTPEHTFGFRDLCKTLREHFPVNENDVKRLMRQKKILTNSIRLDVYSHAVDAGWAVRRPSGKWGNKERFQPRFTQKTVDWLLQELAPLEDVA